MKIKNILSAVAMVNALTVFSSSSVFAAESITVADTVGSEISISQLGDVDVININGYSIECEEDNDDLLISRSVEYLDKN